MRPIRTLIVDDEPAAREGMRHLLAADPEIVLAGARYIVVRPGAAELAFTVVDEFQRQGIASALLHHLVTLARAAGPTSPSDSAVS